MSPKPKMRFTCKTCGAPFSKETDTLVRPCGHDGDGIIAHCEATCYGEGGASQKKKPGVLESLIRTLITSRKKTSA